MAAPISRTTLILVTIVLSILLQIPLAAVVTTLTASTLADVSIHGVAVAASVLNFLVLAALLGAVALLSRLGSQRCGRRRLTLDIAAILLFVTAKLTTIYVLSWTKAQSHSAARELASGDGFVTAGFALWGLSFIVQAPFYTAWIWPWTKSRSLPVVEESPQRSSPVRSVKRSLSVHLASLQPPPPLFKRSSSSAPASPSISTTSTPRSSSRYSMTQIVRPVTSRTRLLLNQARISRDAKSLNSERPVSIETARHDDSFGNWDTSAVEDRCDSALTQQAVRPRLETIPQSRPVSPAKALNGPFIPAAEEVPLPESPMSPTSPGFPASPLSPTSPLSDSAESLYAFPLPSLSRSGSMANEQAHIHPLFRTNTPDPSPPLISPNTTITASPYAGQVISTRSTSGFGSRPGSPSPLVPVLSRASSYKSLRQPGTPIEKPLPDVPPLPKPSEAPGG